MPSGFWNADMHEETIARARELARSTYASSEASERRPIQQIKLRVVEHCACG